MLDTHARSFVQPLIKKVADIFIKLGFSANQVTVLAFFIGISVGFFVYFDLIAIAIILLWISGLLDAVDGTVARIKGSSAFGTLMDITFDRLVEIGMIIALALKHSEHMFLFLLLACSIIITMTVFLTVGSLSQKKSEKSFYYQAGFAERTEGFIFFSGMIIFPSYAYLICLLFTLAILFTASQRMNEARKILK